MRIHYTSLAFPSTYAFSRTAWLNTTWDDVLWAALTIGRPSTYHILRHGPASFHEAIFRLSLIRMALSEDGYGHLRRTSAFASLDPTEKGMVSYFLGMTFTKLFAAELLVTPWLLHLDVFKSVLNPTVLGRSRPDLVGLSASGEWFVFESKGRSNPPSRHDRQKAKGQAQRLVSVGGTPTTLHVGSFAFFRSGTLEFFWADPQPKIGKPIETPTPRQEWKYYYECAMSLAEEPTESSLATERERADVEVQIHPGIRQRLEAGQFSEAHDLAVEISDELRSLGYQPDGLRVIAGDEWRLIREDLEF